MALLAQVSTQKLLTPIIQSSNITIFDTYGTPGYLTAGFLTLATSSSLEAYSLATNSFLTGSISTLGVLYTDGLTSATGSMYVSSLYLGNVGGTIAGYLTTDGAATDLFWNGSKLNDQSMGPGGGITGAQLTSTTIGLGTIGYISTAGGGGGGGAIDYVSAFTVSTGSLEVSSISSYSIYSYGIIATQLFNVGPDPMGITSLTDLTINAASSINTGANSVYVASSNDIRLVAPTNITMDTPQVFANNLFINDSISTYSMTIYGPSTLTVQGLSYFQNIISSAAIVTNTLGVIDSVTGQPSYIQASNGSIDFNGGTILDQTILTSTIEGLGTLGYISSGGAGGGVSQIIAGSNITIDPIGGTGAVTINASGGGGGPSGPVPYLSSFNLSTGYIFNPLQVGTDSNESHLAFYGTDGSYTNSVLAESNIGGTNQELLLFRGSNVSDRIRMQTTGTIVFESGVSSRLWPSVASNVTPAMLIDTSSNVGIQTATPGTALDVVGTGRFTEVSTITVRTNTLFTNTWNVAIQTI